MKQDKEQKNVLENHKQPKIGLTKKIDDLTERLNKLDPKTEKRMQKKYGLKWPAKVKSKMKKAWKKDKIPVIELKNTGIAFPTIGQLKNGNCIVNGIHHDGGKGFVWLWKGKIPIMVIPEWDTNPIGTKQYQESMDEGRTTNHQKITIRAIQMAQQEELKKKKIKGSALVWLGIAAVVVGYLIFSNIGG
jgi:hypothetical protein